MKVYNYDAKTGAYVGASFADPDPLEPLRWLIPANATTIKPPEAILPNTVAKFSNGEWSIVPDFRGTVYWLKRKSYVIENIGEVVPEEGSLTPPEGMGQDPDEPPAEPVPTSELVNQERDHRVLNGKHFYLTGYTDEGGDPIAIHVGGDPVTRENLGQQKDVAELQKAAGVVDPVLKWRDEANIIHLLTPDQMIELWLQGVAYVSAIYEAAWTLKDGGDIPEDFAEDYHWPPYN